MSFGYVNRYSRIRILKRLSGYGFAIFARYRISMHHKTGQLLMLRNHESRGKSQFNVQDRQFNRPMVQYSCEKCPRLYEHSIDRDPKVRILWSPRLNDLTNHLDYTSAAQTIGQITEMIAAGVCNNAGLDKDSLPGIARAILRELIYTFSRCCSAVWYLRDNRQHFVYRQLCCQKRFARYVA